MTDGKTPPPKGELRSLAAEEAEIAEKRRADMDARRLPPRDQSNEPSSQRQRRTASVKLESSPRTTVVVAMMAAFIAYVVGRSPDNIELPEQKVLAAWAAMAIILAIAVDIGPTSEIAAALAVLIFVTVMLQYGVPLFDWLNKKTLATSSGGGGGKKRA